MTTKFEVGDDIWWLDTRGNYKPSIRRNTVLDIVKEACGAYGYLILDNDYIWSGTIVLAKTKEELINILYPPKIGRFDYNQFVYVIETNGHSININVTTSLVIDKGYIKQFSSKNNQYLVGEHKDINNKDMFWYDETSIYKSVEGAKQIVGTWLNNNDN